MRLQRPPREDEIFLPFPTARAVVPDATHFRSTWLSSSLQAIRALGHLDRYLELLPRHFHDSVLGTVAGMWLPIEVAIAHYRALDQLGLPRHGANAIGLEVTRKVHGTSLKLAVRLAQQAGVTPWTIFSQMHRLWDRVWVGGGLAVYKVGPKEAVVEAIRWRVAEIPYVRYTMPAVTLGIVEMFCQKAFVHDVPELASHSSLGMRVQWA
jgi:hypothetical protein